MDIEAVETIALINNIHDSFKEIHNRDAKIPILKLMSHLRHILLIFNGLFDKTSLKSEVNTVYGLIATRIIQKYLGQLSNLTHKLRKRQSKQKYIEDLVILESKFSTISEFVIYAFYKDKNDLFSIPKSDER